MQRLIPGALAFLILVFPAATRADAPDPLRVIPAGAEWVVKIENPRQIVRTIVAMPLFEELKKLEVFREAYETTNARRFYQLVAYFENALGHPYVELIDRLAGGGIALSAKLTEGKRHFIVAVQAKDKELLQKFVRLSFNLVEQELARLELKDRLKWRTSKDDNVLEIGRIGHAALIDDTLIFASDANALQAALATLRGGKSILSEAAIVQARQSLPDRPVAWSWLNLAAMRNIPQFKAGLEQVTLDPGARLTFGGLSDIVSRAPYAVAGLYQRDNDFSLTLRAPTGRQGMQAAAEIFVPHDGAGSLPLLEPASALGSMSYFLDLGKFWENRKTILGEAQVKGLEEADKQSGMFLGGVKLGKLLSQAGPHQRIVVVQQTKAEYKIKPKQQIPAFAVVLSMRDPDFAKNMETVLRSAALLGTFQADLKLVEEKRGPHTLIGYRFPEEGSGKFGPDYESIQYNFSPCFVTVGKQFIVSSTIELGRELIDLVSKEQNTKPSPATTRMRLYSSGAADIMRSTQDVLLTQFILGQALSPQEAGKQLRQAIELVERLGVLDVDVAYGANDAQVNLRVRLGNR